MLKTSALKKEGIAELREKITFHQNEPNRERSNWLKAEKAYQLIRNKRMVDVSKAALKNEIERAGSTFNLYRFVASYA
ncbi:MAG: hypothetical protein EOO03_10700 [Chitinophagaceae bacterium]|nr:MAG: hypothetical protein EOO03_10700 [Chitinophagaceae bacterium]